MQPADLHPKAARVQEVVNGAGINSKVLVLDDSARTVPEAAAALGVKEGQIAKSLVFLADGEPVMVVASGDERVDTKALGTALNKTITRADADTVRDATGYSIGGVSPFGLPETLPILIERSLARFDVVWAAAGTAHAVIPTHYDDLVQITGGTPSEVGTTAND